MKRRSSRSGNGGGNADQGSPQPPVDPYQKALGLLARREHSRRDLERKLADCGADPAQSGVALDRMAERGYQNDERFARALARTRSTAGHGPQRIRAELGPHGMDADQIAAALEACEVDWDSAALDLIRRRFPGTKLADPKQRRKAVEFLLRRGFSRSSAFAAVRSPGATSDAED